ncbi:MAG: hypothetical protein D6710_05785, partial [Nitrospirae bacterium]
ISGAEGIYRKEELTRVLPEYINRALTHERGRPDRVFLTVEPVKDEPLYISSLPVYTASIDDHKGAWLFIHRLLTEAGISEESFAEAKGLVLSGLPLRGAAVYSLKTARRVDPNRERGIRARLLGITDEAKEVLERILSEKGLNIRVVSEAIVLASKVLNAPEVVAELCVSDNPSYTTGYVSLKGLGYVRVPFIKREGEHAGGRVFFVREDADIDKLRDYLEEKPVVVNEISAFHGIINPDEIIGLVNSKSCLRKVF